MGNGSNDLNLGPSVALCFCRGKRFVNQCPRVKIPKEDNDYRVHLPGPRVQMFAVRTDL